MNQKENKKMSNGKDLLKAMSRQYSGAKNSAALNALRLNQVIGFVNNRLPNSSF